MLGLEPLPRSLEAALRDVRDDKARVRVSAVHDLSRYAAGPEASAVVRALVAALEDPAAEVRGEAAIALADAGAKDAVDPLLRAVADDNVRVRQMVLIALGELGEQSDDRIVDLFRAKVADPLAPLRFQALIAANALELPFAGDALVQATGDVDAEVRHIALRLLEERSTTAELGVDPSHAVLAAARERLSDTSLGVRLAAAILLGRTGDRAGRAVIAEGVAKLDASLDPEDEQAAIVLAGELALSEAAPGLERRAFRAFARGRAFAYEARIALAKMGHARAKASILRGLSAFARDTRTLAVVAAGRAQLIDALPLLRAMRTDERRADPGAVEEALSALGGGQES